ncbi:MAG: DNA alkylation repair protein [Bacteroidia bacterium]|nr:DNA alkylation repair protein [Bacteroidia bacterium]
MENIEAILFWLNENKNDSFRIKMERFAIKTDTAFGIRVPLLRNFAKIIGKNTELARELWKSNYHEARIISVLISKHNELTEKDMDQWVNDFNSWDICDQACMNIFDKTPFADKKIHEWALREEEFVRRAAFALIASIAIHDKKAKNDKFFPYLNLIEKYSFDNRNFVKKAVNWALRQIGKRNIELGTLAIECSERLLKQPHKSAQWIAKDAIKELNNKWGFSK